MAGYNYAQNIIGLNKSGGGGGNKHHYSTEEQIIGKWVDGSDVYEKTYISNITVTSSDTIIISHTNMPDYDKIISMSATLKATNSSNLSVFGVPGQAMAFYIDPDGDAYAKQTFIQSNLASTETIVTLRYTKPIEEIGG